MLFRSYARYIRLMRQGGESYYGDLLKEAGLASPFEDGALEVLCGKMEPLLQQLKAQL